MMAGPLVVALLAVLAFVATFLKIGLVPKARQALSTARDGVAALTSTTLDENAKEKAVQQAGLRLLGLGGALLWRLAVLVGAALVPIQLASLLGLVPFASSMAVLLNGWFILGTTLALLGVAWAYAKTTGGQASGNKAQQGYSAAEQVIHMVAFIPALQRALMKIDTKRFLRRHAFRNPKVIIVTSIARGGHHDLPERALQPRQRRNDHLPRHAFHHRALAVEQMFGPAQPKDLDTGTRPWRRAEDRARQPRGV